MFPLLSTGSRSGALSSLHTNMRTYPITPPPNYIVCDYAPPHSSFILL